MYVDVPHGVLVFWPRWKHLPVIKGNARQGNGIFSCHLQLERSFPHDMKPIFENMWESYVCVNHHAYAKYLVYERLLLVSSAQLYNANQQIYLSHIIHDMILSQTCRRTAVQFLFFELPNNWKKLGIKPYGWYNSVYCHITHLLHFIQTSIYLFSNISTCRIPLDMWGCKLYLHLNNRFSGYETPTGATYLDTY